MIKFKTTVLSILFSAVAVFALAQTQPPPRPLETCSIQVPYGTPSIKQEQTTICRTAYLVVHDPYAKIPAWVSWTLIPEHVIGCAPRINAFAADQSLPREQRSTPQDYAGSGYDQGHLANNADMSWDADVARESFLMSNISPQVPSVNRGTWKNLESAGRAWVHQTGQPHTIYAGNIWSQNSKTIGTNRVVVPDFIFKIVINNSTGKAYAFLFPNKNGLDSNFVNYQVTVAEIEQIAEMTFPVPDDKNIKNPVPVPDIKKVADDKKRICNE